MAGAVGDSRRRSATAGAFAVLSLLVLETQSQPPDWQEEFLKPLDDAAQVERVPVLLKNMVLLAYERVNNPDIKEDDPMLNPTIREQLKQQGFAFGDQGFAGGMPGDRTREANLQKIKKAHRSETVPLADDFEPGYPELWQKVLGGMVSPDCGSVEGEALCFDEDGDREVITTPLRILGGGMARFALWMSVDGHSAEVQLEAQTSGSQAWQPVASFSPSTYQLPAPANPNSAYLDNGDALDIRGFVFFNIPLPTSVDSGATRLRWIQRWNPAMGGGAPGGPARWALDNVEVELGQVDRPAVILTPSEDVSVSEDRLSTTQILTVMAQFSDAVIAFDKLRIKVIGGTVASINRFTGTAAGHGEMYTIAILLEDPSTDISVQVLEGAGMTKKGRKSMASNSLVLMPKGGDGTGGSSVHTGYSAGEQRWRDNAIDLDATGISDPSETEPRTGRAMASDPTMSRKLADMQSRIEYLEREVRRLQTLEADMKYLKASLLRTF